MAATAGSDIAGRGAREGARLFQAWYDELTAAAERGEPTAYVFVMGSLVEVLRAFDLHVVFPEINSLQTAVKKVADGYLGEAEDHGFSPDVCGYVKADYALQLRKGEHPRGTVPPPSLVVLTNACNTYLKWAEIWERLYDAPLVTVDVPGSRAAPGVPVRDPDPERDRRWVEHQIRELITACETLTGRAFDVERLREVLALTNAMGRSYRRLLELNRARPAPYDATMEGTVFLGVANALRGTEEGARYFRELVEEMEARVAAGEGPPRGGNERHRLAFVGVPCYPIFSRFYEMFSGWDGAFVTSSYLWFASGGLNEPFEYDLDRPVESLAEGVLRGVRRAVDSMLFLDTPLLEAIDAYAVDGVVYHPVKSCRTVSTGLADSRRVVLDARDVLALYIESDMMDKRVVSEAQLKNRIDAFFEGLESRRLRRAGGTEEPRSARATAAAPNLRREEP